nr:hypothetical protein [Streptomyces sp. Ru72]
MTRHALFRLPGIALRPSALGFLGLGAQPPFPEWGLLLAEHRPRVRGPGRAGRAELSASGATDAPALAISPPDTP